VAAAAAASGTKDAENPTLATRIISVRRTMGLGREQTPRCERVSRSGHARPRPPSTAWAIIDTHRVPIEEVKSNPGTQEAEMIGR
jgi:hypothetical protein